MQKDLKALPRQQLKIDDVRKELRKFVPKGPGVYIFFTDKPIYIGKANSLLTRVLSYFGPNLEVKTLAMTTSARSLAFIKVNSEFEALLLEASLIRKYQPQYNIISKDDKHALYIAITKEEFPRILSVRKLLTTSYKLLASFGPFPNSTNVNRVLKTLRRIFPYSDHKIGKRGCIYLHIGLCNPCPSVITGIKNQESRISERKKYLRNIRYLKSILSGHIDKVKSELNRDMAIFSKNQKYEEALESKKLIEKFEYITSPRIDSNMFLENPNLYDDMREKEMVELKNIIGSKYPNMETLRRIECFDVAHMSGTFPTASMVTFVNAEADKSLYRHFKLNKDVGGDDVLSMKEVIDRRKKHFTDWGKPDLIIVDGGKPQLKYFSELYESEKIPVVGLAKRFETIIFPDFTELRIPRGNALNLLQRIRDEAHRFARRLHHKLLTKSLIPQKS